MKGNSTRSLGVLGVVALVVAVALAVRARGSADPRAKSPSTAPVSATAPIFLEFGSDRCTSCRAMIPVLEELRSTHGCALTVRFIDVWDHPEEGERFNVRTIPSQVLLDPGGKELTRHTGFWSAEAIRAAFAANGYTLTRDPESCGQ